MIFMLRALSALSSLLLSVAVAFLYSDEVFASFTIFVSTFTISSVLFRLGSEKTLVRRLSKLESAEDLSLDAFNSLYLVTVWTLISSIPLFFILKNVLDYEYSFDAIVTAALLTLLLFISHVIRSQQRVGISIFFAGIYLPFAVLLAMFAFQSGFPDSFRTFYIVLVPVGIIAGTVVLCRIIPNLRPRWVFHVDRLMLRESIGSLIHTFAVVGMQHIPVILVGASFASSGVAEYQYAVMFSMIIGILPLALSATFEVSFSKTEGDIVKVRECRSKLQKSILSHVAVLFPVLIVVGCVLYYYGIVSSIYLLVCVVIGQLVNLMSIQYQAENLMVWDVRLATKASVLGFAIATLLMLASMNISTLLKIEVFATCVTIGYLAKFLFLYLNRRP